MPAQSRRVVAFGRQIVGVHDLQRVIEHALGDQVRVELACRRLAVMRLQHGGQGRRAVEVKAKPAARPEQQFSDAFQVGEIAYCLRMVLGKNVGVEVRDIAFVLLQRQPHGHAVRRSAQLFAEGAVRQHGRTE